MPRGETQLEEMHRGDPRRDECGKKRRVRKNLAAGAQGQKPCKKKHACAKEENGKIVCGCEAGSADNKTSGKAGDQEQ